MKNSLCIALWSGLFLLVAACEATNSPNARSSAQSIRTVFTTSGVFNGDLATAGGGITGLIGADKLCQLAAGSVGAIVPTGDYIALLSTSSVNASARLSPNDLGYVLPDGVTLIEINKANLLDGRILAPINQDEFGNVVSGVVTAWTGSDAFGSFFYDRSCGDWRISDRDLYAAGIVGSLSGPLLDKWLFQQGFGCNIMNRLYCFQQ